jgi:hypothetical protein
MDRINLADLHHKFDRSINWNALFFIANKASITLASFLMFKKLTPEYYSLWANIYSVVFSVLLWADLGFRKSIPQFLPSFANNKVTHKKFINFITKLQIASLLVGAIGTIYFFSCQGRSCSSLPILLGIAMFLAEGPLALLRLFYHSHFLNKEFNITYSAVLLVEIISNLVAILYLNDSYQIVVTIIGLKIISALTINVLSIHNLKSIYKKFHYTGSGADYSQNKKQFIKHSSAMWTTTNLKSLSERNFVIPVLTAFVGIEFANMFKVANDGAILIQRVILKLVGSSDTALLAHIDKGCQKSLDQNFKKLAAKTWVIALPLFGLLGFLYLCQFYFSFWNIIIFQSFACLAFFYLIENLLCPYERMLEAHFNYKPIIGAHVIYLIALLILWSNLQGLSLFSFVVLLCCVRLVSFAIQALYVRTWYRLKFPYL